MSHDELREWYADYLEACNRHDLTELRTRIAPNVRRSHLPGGVDAWIDGLAVLFRGFPNWQWQRVAVIVEGDRLAAHLRASGTHAGEFHHTAPTGAHVNVAEFAMYRIIEGRITEYAGTGDNMELLRQLRS